MTAAYDDAVVGAGVIGLAHTYHLAKRGRRVALFERHPKARSASVRNFGMLWPIGQPAGPLHDMAMRSLEIWLDILKASQIWHDQVGALFVAHHDDEWAILQEIRETAPSNWKLSLLTPEAVRAKSPAINEVNLRGGLFSPVETCIDPREAIGQIPLWLRDSLGVDLHFHEQVHSFSRSIVATNQGECRARRLWVCSGEEVQILYPETFRSMGLRRCKLQMLRASITDSRFDLGPMLAGGLTLRHYQSFERSLSLAALRQRIASSPEPFDRYGIHVMASQNGRGQITIGDSHEYDLSQSEPFNKECIDRLILSYLRSILDTSSFEIEERWHGIYMKHPEKPYLVETPEENVTIINGLGGNGMTLSFGLSERIVESILGRSQE